MERKAYPSDVSDAEWALVAPYLTLMTQDAPQRDYPLREVFNGLRWMARGGSSWRMMPHDLPPWYVIYQQMRRWLKAGVFEAIAHDLRAVLRIAEGRQEMPTASIFDSRTMQATVESGARAGYDGAKRRKGNLASPMGGGTKFWLAISIPPVSERLRAITGNPGRSTLPGLRDSDVKERCGNTDLKLITRSSEISQANFVGGDETAQCGRALG